MNQEVKIIDCYATDNSQLGQFLQEGWSVMQAISYEQKYFNPYTHYEPNGNFVTKHELQSITPMIKYSMYRDGISRLLHG